MIRSAAIPLILATVAGCAQQPGPAPATAASSGRDCFSARNVSGFSALNDDTVDLQVGARRHYRLELAGVCPNVNWATGVALVARSGGSFICQGLDAELVVPNPGLGPQRCLVSSVRRLSDAEVQALRRR